MDPTFSQIRFRIRPKHLEHLEPTSGETSSPLWMHVLRVQVEWLGEYLKYKILLFYLLKSFEKKKHTFFMYEINDNTNRIYLIHEPRTRTQDLYSDCRNNVGGGGYNIVFRRRSQPPASFLIDIKNVGGGTSTLFKNTTNKKKKIQKHFTKMSDFSG